MPRLILPGGTDIAQVGLFSTDALPVDRRRRLRALSELERGCQMIRMPTGADGAYLLHAYVDEPIPAELRRFCSREDTLTGEFRSVTGNVAFGGLESAFRNFKPNHRIRTDATVTPGTYTYTAYRTEYPDEMVSADPTEGLRTRQRLFLSIPGYIGLVVFITIAVSLATEHFLRAAILVAVCVIVIRTLVGSARYKALTRKFRERALQYPSIVIELRSAAGRDT
jgi:hypothetical protein